MLSFVVIANRRHTDLYEWGQRTTRFTLPAEIQRRLLPAAFTCEAGAFTLSAWLEPAASIGGDTFDYCLGRDGLHLSVTDAMGHGVASALTATLCVGSLRNSRRSGASLLEQARPRTWRCSSTRRVPMRRSSRPGLLGRLDLRTGCLSMVNAGHVAPYLWRAGQVSAVPLPPNVPWAFPGLGVPLHRREPGAGGPPGAGHRWDVGAGRGGGGPVRGDRADAAAASAETTRSLADMVVAACGPDLADDATLLILDWYGGHGDARVTVAGAEPSYASAPRVQGG